LRKRPAIVQFIGDENRYILGCGTEVEQQGLRMSYRYCRDCPIKGCRVDQSTLAREFIIGNTYKAYLLDLWETEWTSLYVESETGEICNYIDVVDFCVVYDPDEVVAIRNAKVRRITKDSDDTLHECIGYSWMDSVTKRFYTRHGVIPKSDMTYYIAEAGETSPYPAEYFEIVDDPYDTLGRYQGTEVFWWERQNVGRRIYGSEYTFSFDLKANGAGYFSIHMPETSQNRIVETNYVENGAPMVLADYSETGELLGVEIIGYDVFAPKRMFEEDGVYWLNFGTFPPVNIELGGWALDIALSRKSALL